MAIRKPLRKRPGKPSGDSPSSKETTTTKAPLRRRTTKPETASPRTTSAGIARGADGFDRAREQQSRQQEEFDRRKEKPYAFRITQKDITARKNEVELLYLDKVPFFVRLHTIPNARGGFDDEVCLADTGEDCPLCRKLGKEGTWTLVMTALDKRSYRNREGVLVKQSKKLVIAKTRNIDKFERQYKKHGTLRGLVCTHRRQGAKEASIGEDLEFKPKLVPEAIIAKSGDLSKTTDYAKVFAALSPDAMESRYANIGPQTGGGGRPGAGRAKQDDDDDAPAW